MPSSTPSWELCSPVAPPSLWYQSAAVCLTVSVSTSRDEYQWEILLSGQATDKSTREGERERVKDWTRRFSSSKSSIAIKTQDLRVMFNTEEYICRGQPLKALLQQKENVLIQLKSKGTSGPYTGAPAVGPWSQESGQVLQTWSIFSSIIMIKKLWGRAMGEVGGWCTLPCMSYVSFRFFSVLCFLSINVLEYNCVII